MKTKKQFINNAERFTMYENGELSDEERNKLEYELKNNSDLKLEYKVFQEVNDFLKRNKEKLRNY